MGGKGKGAETMKMSNTADFLALREFLIQYNKLSQRCFNECVSDFKLAEVSEGEAQCTSKCLRKHMKVAERLSVRFQEHQMLNAEFQGAPVSLTGGGVGSQKAQ